MSHRLLIDVQNLYCFLILKMFESFISAYKVATLINLEIEQLIVNSVTVNKERIKLR